jgi:diguanylate cyclase (GGDEF)-like protein/PAS domain S-box-containing protein
MTNAQVPTVPSRLSDPAGGHPDRDARTLHTMLESIGDAFFAIDRDWRITYANRKAMAFSGLDMGATMGLRLLDVSPELADSDLPERYRRAMATGEPCTVETWWKPTSSWLEVRAYPNADGLCVYFHDITDKRRDEHATRRSEQRFRNLFQQAGDSILIVDRTLRVVAANARACTHLGYTEAELLSLSMHDIDVDRSYDAAVLDALHAGRTQLLRTTQRRKDGSTFPSEVQVTLIEERGAPYLQAIVRDLTEREEALHRLRESERRFREVIEMTPSAYLLASAAGRILDVNPALCALTGHARTALVGAPLDLLFASMPWYALDVPYGAGTTVTGVEATLRHASGRPLHVLFNGSARRGADGALESFTGLMTDITERKSAEQRLRELATHDTLTGLPNRALLHERLQRMLDTCPDGDAVAVLFLDLDRFKEVNDSFGHELGDALLCEAAMRLRMALGPDDVIARLGGDEFVVAARCRAGGPDALARARAMLGALAAPVRIGAQEVTVGASIGISQYPGDARTRELLFQHADTAMYRAKAAGRNGFRCFEPDMARAARARMALEMALRPALARAEFELHYQPRIDLSTMTVNGVEALIRWQHPTLGRVPPGDFIGIAEENGLIVEIGRWVLQEACRHTRRLLDEFGRPIRVSVNVSARQLAQPGFVDEVRAALAAADLAPDHVELELTESALIENIEHAAAVLGELHGLGVKLAVDDFGTGYSGLAYLRRFPIDVLKLDRSFVLHDDGRISAFDFVKAFVDMAHALRMAVVAEGVETAEVLDFLRAANCDEVQGYLLARPMPLADLRAMLGRA